MKSYLILIIFWLFSLLLPDSRGHSTRPQTAASVTAPKKTVTLINPVQTVKAMEPAIPAQLIIPAIGLDTKILSVDLNEENLVTVPPADAGWYVRSAKPGNPGNAVLQGHVRNFDLTPGIFSRLSELRSGDDIYTVDSNGTRIHFRVSAQDRVEAASFPLEKVYGSSAGSNLNLVTCAGTYDPHRQDYLERTIIYAQLATP